ncbi:unnamed protein product [Trifolium pratense]|uniref:Uncharacterized protein n=1 Tax=Trifolium pratense TaxID=57577 RepID=A0ACB0KIN5_TRIPR|nr:unnamed protein product [Trifolium pratense]
METNSNQKNAFTSFSCSVKLDRGNYMLWESLVLRIIKGEKMYGYISGTSKCPEEFITEGGKQKQNPAYEEWIANDQKILGWLLNSMTHDIATQLLHCDTSKELWDAAKSLAGAHSRSRVTLLKSEFHSTRKGTLKMEEYLIKMKNLSDNLKLAGSPISTTDLIIQTLSGLDSEYNAIVVQLSNKLELTWIDMQAELLAFENRIEFLNNLSNLTLNPSANVAARYENKGNRSFNTGGWRGGNHRGPRGGRGRGRFYQDKTKCQVCGLTNHIAVDCYYRFDKSYMGQPSEKQQKYGGHNHNAYVASSSSVRDPDWYFDSGASNHVTHESNHLQDFSEHDGQDDRKNANGRET